MKIYIVTAGCYSDYHIEKVFADKDKADNYRKWCYDANEVEEYDTEDEFQFKGFYQISIKYKINNNGKNSSPLIDISRRTNKQICKNFTSIMDCRMYGGEYIEMFMTRFISEENWDEEFYRNKYTKAAYDIAAVVQQKLLEGFTIKQINELIGNTYND